MSSASPAIACDRFRDDLVRCDCSLLATLPATLHSQQAAMFHSGESGDSGNY